MLKLGVLYIFILLLTVQLPAQKPAQVLEWMNTVKVDQKDFYYEIPFTFRNNHIVIPVTVGGITYQYVFDTGGYNDITDAIQGKNNYPVLTTQTVGSANRLKAKVNVVKVDSISIAGLVLKDLAMLQMNFDNTPSMQCGVDGGLIGASIIKPFVWQINYATKMIILTDKLSNLSLPPGTIKIPVTFNNRLMPYLDVTLEGQSEKMLFDLGSSTLISLTDKTAEKYKTNKPIIDIVGGASEGGNGTVAQPIHIMKADSVLMGGLTLRNRPVVYTALSNENLVGNPIIKDAIVTLNFKEGELWLSPLEKRNDGWESFGFTAAFKDGAIKVTILYTGLAADKAGLRIGDEILSVNGDTIKIDNDCAARIWLQRMFSDNNKIMLSVKRGNEMIAITIAKAKVY